MSESTTAIHKIAVEKRIMNEYRSKILNEERLDAVVELRKTSRLSPFSELAFKCECDDRNCAATILMSTEEYTHVHNKSKQFIVIPSHVRLDLEDIVATFTTYVLVEKFFATRS